jgi:hypothetical protein
LAEQTSWDLDGIQIELEPPDLLLVRNGRAPTVEDIRRKAEIFGQLARQRGSLYLILYAPPDMAPEVRKEIALVYRPDWFAGVATIGATPTVELGIKSLQLSMRGFASPDQVTRAFVSSEAEGREFIARLKARSHQKE